MAFLSKVLEHVDGEGLHELEHRIVIQKKLYLAQKVFGVDLGYVFAWNLFGPFSKELARECSALEAFLPAVKEVSAPLKLRRNIVRALEEVRMLRPPKNVDLSKGAWLELLGSTHMLATYAFRQSPIAALNKKQKRQIEEELLARKPYFDAARTCFPSVWKVLSRA